MFLNEQNEAQIVQYKELLKSVGSLSRLFSESESPSLYYRAAENAFCRSFGAKNLSRSDVAIDASLGNLGIGLKTFLKTAESKLEKVAEFNAQSSNLRLLTPEQQIREVCRLRNQRLETSKTIYGLDHLAYHCVVREPAKMTFVESSMHFIDLDTLSITDVSNKSLKFRDNKEEYSFNLSKSTLFKRFHISEPVDYIDVEILADPFSVLSNLLNQKKELDLVFKEIDKEKNYVVLPLYSTRLGENGEKTVPEKSGLNQWNAGGRPRNLGEVYIPVPAFIHKQYEGFFPPQDEQFTLELPNKRTLQAKICQEGGKALMTNPNTDLGQWILRDVLKLQEGELLAYKKLEDLGLDSVVVYKTGLNSYKIDFAKIGVFESFLVETLTRTQ